jgi:hypothetical protein
MQFDIHSFSIAKKVKHKLTEIRSGRAEDVYDWMFKV